MLQNSSWDLLNSKHPPYLQVPLCNFFHCLLFRIPAMENLFLRFASETKNNKTDFHSAGYSGLCYFVVHTLLVSIPLQLCQQNGVKQSRTTLYKTKGLFSPAYSTSLNLTSDGCSFIPCQQCCRGPEKRTWEQLLAGHCIE